MKTKAMKTAPAALDVHPCVDCSDSCFGFDPCVNCERARKYEMAHPEPGRTTLKATCGMIEGN